jgi:cellulose synthase/poly-beta-1,6-N-acetylglucosamine synthase-like glycosyltransferase/dienelactone hydrolase
MTSSPGDNFREQSIWFGVPERQIFGRLTTPVNEESRGGVLISPPIGRESRLARRALRSLAISLATEGYVSLRFDHYGSGDSVGSVEDDDFVEALLEGIDRGVTLLRSLGIVDVSAVGMRMGASITGVAAQKYDLGLSSLAMWDPCESGRSYVRELEALVTLRREESTVEVGELTKMLEYPLSDRAAGNLKELDLREVMAKSVAGRVLVVVRSDRAVSTRFRAQWTSEEVEWATTDDQGPMLEAQLSDSVQPTSTVARVAEWLTAPAPLLAPYVRPPDQIREAVMEVGSNQVLVRESVVELGFRNMFGIVTEPLVDPQGPLMVMVNGVNEDHIGPARLWVELSRQWASLGLRSIRFDLSESGESPWIPGQPDRPIFDKTRRRDVADAIRALDPNNPSNSVLIGYCSGAQLALEVAMDINSRGVCAINPGSGPGVLQVIARVRNSRREDIQASVQRVEGLLIQYRLAERVIRRAMRYVESLTFPPRIATKLSRDDSDVLLLLSPVHIPRFQRIPILRRRLLSSEHHRVEIIPGMDHSILSTLGRDRAVALLHQHVVDRYVGVSAQPYVDRGNAVGSFHERWGMVKSHRTVMNVPSRASRTTDGLLTISVVIVNKDDRLLSDTLRMLEPFVGNTIVEVVVVDASNGALDDIRVANEWARWIDFVQPPGIRTTIPHQRNIGVRAAEGDVIVFTDSGCLPEDGWLEKLLSPILTEGEDVSCGPAKAIGKSIYSGERFRGVRDAKYVPAATTINIAFRREAYEAVGGFDESFGAAEDIDYTWRLTDHGYRLRWVPDAVVLHDWGTPKRQLRRSFFYGKGMCRLLKKHPHRIGDAAKQNSAPFVYPLFLLGLPLTLKCRWYPLLLLWPAWRQRNEELPWLVLLDHLVAGAGVLYELVSPGT